MAQLFEPNSQGMTHFASVGILFEPRWRTRRLQGAKLPSSTELEVTERFGDIWLSFSDVRNLLRWNTCMIQNDSNSMRIYHGLEHFGLANGHWLIQTSCQV